MKTREQIIDIKKWFEEKYSSYNRSFSSIEVIQILTDFHNKIESLTQQEEDVLKIEKHDFRDRHELLDFIDSQLDECKKIEIH